MAPAWPGARNADEAAEARKAWLRAVARGCWTADASRADELPPSRLARALAAYVRGRRQREFFAVHVAEAERRLDRLVAAHGAADGRGGAGTPPIA